MFERFTERARRVVILAQEEAQTLGHGHIGTEHLLLGLLREEEGLAARVLESADITMEDARRQVVQIVGLGHETGTGQIPFTPGAKGALELSMNEALSLGHNYIGTEHILLGLFRDEEGIAARILLDFDVDAGKLRNEIIRMLSGPGRSSHPTPPVEEVELVSPPLAHEVIAEIDRLGGELQSAIERHEFESAALLRDERDRLREAAATLVRAWERHTAAGDEEQVSD